MKKGHQILVLAGVECGCLTGSSVVRRFSDVDIGSKCSRDIVESIACKPIPGLVVPSDVKTNHVAQFGLGLALARQG